MHLNTIVLGISDGIYNNMTALQQLDIFKFAGYIYMYTSSLITNTP